MIEVHGGIVCAGNLVYDILVRPVNQLRFGSTQWVDSIEQHIGGNGSNTAYGLGLLGVPVRLFGMLGRDDFGERVRARLAGAGVDLSGVLPANSPTATTVALVDPGGARCLLHCPGASREAFPDPLDFTSKRIGSCSHFHLANVFALPNLRRHGAETLRRARAAGLTTSLDTGWDALGEWLRVLAPCLPHLDLLFVNEDEAFHLTGEREPRAAARRLREQGVSDVVVKLGGRGCAVFHGETEVHAAGFPVQAVDTTGAGDSFVAGFLAGLYHAMPCADAAQLANAAGALSVQKIGSVEGLLPYSQTVEWIRRQRDSQFRK